MDITLAFWGDSVPWRQGLLDPQKYYRVLAERVRTRHPDWQISTQLLAHSGAVITTATTELAGADGEVPVAYPSILKQASDISGPPDAQKLYTCREILDILRCGPRSVAEITSGFTFSDRGCCWELASSSPAAPFSGLPGRRRLPRYRAHPGCARPN